MNNRFFVIEFDNRPADAEHPKGVVNQTITERSDFAQAVSYYFERKSKMYVTDLYTGVSLLLVHLEIDENGRMKHNTLREADIETQYKLVADSSTSG